MFVFGKKLNNINKKSLVLWTLSQYLEQKEISKSLILISISKPINLNLIFKWCIKRLWVKIIAYLWRIYTQE